MEGTQEKEVEYRDIAGFPGYRVGSNGTVWSKRVVNPKHFVFGEWKPCSLYRRPYGSKHVVVCMRAIPGGKVSCHYVHRLVLEAFVGQCPDGKVCRHFPDRDTANNNIGNLSWGTQEENIHDKRTHGTSGVKLTEDDVRKIILLRHQGSTRQELSSQFSVSTGSIDRIVSGKTWRWIRACEVTGLLSR